jgi:hypothetical protein
LASAFLNADGIGTAFHAIAVRFVTLYFRFLLLQRVRSDLLGHLYKDWISEGSAVAIAHFLEGQLPVATTEILLLTLIAA